MPVMMVMSVMPVMIVMTGRGDGMVG